MSLSRTNLVGAISGSSGNFGTGNFVTGSFTPPDGSLIAAAAMLINIGSVSDPTTDFAISGGGLTWTEQLAIIVSATSFPTLMKIWTAPVGTGASMTLTLSAAGRNIGVYATSAVAYNGYNVSSPVGAKATGVNGTITGPPTPFSMTLSGAPATDSEVFAGVAFDKNVAGASVTPGSAYTEIYDNSNSSWGGIETEVRTGSTSTTVDWVDLRDTGGALFNWVAGAIEIKASTGPVPISLTESGAGTDSMSVRAGLALAESGAGTDGISVSRVVPGRQGVTGWDLWSTLQQQAEYKTFYDTSLPLACPFDGTPLKTAGPRNAGYLYCPNGDFRYPEDWDPDTMSGM